MALSTYLATGVLGGNRYRRIHRRKMVGAHRPEHGNPPDCVATRHGVGSTTSLCAHPHHSIGLPASGQQSLDDSVECGAHQHVGRIGSLVGHPLAGLSIN